MRCSIESAWFQRLKLEYNKPLSRVPFNLNLRRYNTGMLPMQRRRFKAAVEVDSQPSSGGGAAPPRLANGQGCSTLRRKCPCRLVKRVGKVRLVIWARLSGI